MDTIDSENNVFEDVLEEEINLLVSISQSNSDLPSESKGIKVDSKYRDKYPMEKSDQVDKSL